MRLRVGLAGRNTRAALVAGLLFVARRGRKAAAVGLARNAVDAFGLRYRIITPGFEDGDFRLWADLPAIPVSSRTTDLGDARRRNPVRVAVVHAVRVGAPRCGGGGEGDIVTDSPFTNQGAIRCAFRSG